MKTRQQQLTRIGIAFVVFVASTIYYHFRASHNEDALNAMFHNRVFNMPGVTSGLTFYSDKPAQLAIKLEAFGLPEEAKAYKPHLLAFICSQPALKKILITGKPIELDLSAPDRESGRHVNMHITESRCHYHQTSGYKS